MGNERADRLAAAAAGRAHRNCVLSADDMTERHLENMTDTLIVNLLAVK